MTTFDLIFVSMVTISILRWIVVMWGATRFVPPPAHGKIDTDIDVLIPAYNEAKVIARTVEAVLRSDVPVRVFVIDDGSSDDTVACVPQHPQVRVLKLAANMGKAAALNVGLRTATSPVVVTVDADTLVDPACIGRLAGAILGSDAVAAAGTIHVGNRRSWLGVWQSYEYIAAIHLQRRAQAHFGIITTVPGAACGLRREQVIAAGGFSRDTLTEDTDLTFTLLRQGAAAIFVPEALADTEAPSTWPDLLRQRRRWHVGYLQTLRKHADAPLQGGRAGLVAWPIMLEDHLLSFAEGAFALAYLPRWIEVVGVPGLALLSALGLTLELGVGLWIYRRAQQPAREVWLAPLRLPAWGVFRAVVLVAALHQLAGGRPHAWQKLPRMGLPG